jgi:hypothetical protein
VYEPPAHEITAEATAAVTERQLVAGSGNRSAGGNVAVAPAGAGARALGAACWNANTGQLVRIARGAVLKVIAGGAITAGDPIASDANGHAVTATGTAVVIGLAVNGAAAAGDVAEVAWY